MTLPIAAYSANAGIAHAQNQLMYFLATDPSTSTVQSNLGTYPVGAFILNTVNGNLWQLKSYTAAAGLTSANWDMISSGSGSIVAVNGTASQVTVNTAGNTATVSLPAAIVTPGSLNTTTSLSATTTVTAGTGITSTTGNITATNGNLVMGTAGNKLVVPATSNATCSAGTFTLSGAATTTVANSAVTASSLIFFQVFTLGTVSTASTFSYTKSAGTNFIVTPSASTDTSVVNYLIIN